MTDGRALAREFLEQQRQLGGDAVILPDQAGGGRRETGEVHPAPAAPPPASRLPASDLPPPGISYDPPGSDLFSNDPVPQAISLDAIAQLVAGCTKCRLCEGRRHTVPGEGAADARLVVVGEGPGRVEDETGRPFVGPAGELLTKILGAIELPRERVFICNVVKCRPPENRLPQFDEIAERDPRHGRDGRADPAQHQAIAGSAAELRAPIPRYSLDRDLSSGCPAPQPELEETDLG